MIKVILIDDEHLARGLVREYLETYNEIEIADECSDGFEGVKSIIKHQPDLIFLDIQMPKLNGFEMLELLDKAPAVIFTTAFDEYALKAFESHAIDYLLKPFSKERFDKAIQKWLNQKNNPEKAESTQALLNESNKQPEEKKRIVVKEGSQIVILSLNDIFYIEAFDDYVKVFTKDNLYVKKKTMSYYESTLDAVSFLRVHRSYIINLNHITRIEVFEKNNHIALLKNGASVSLSRAGYLRLKETLGL